MKIAVTGAAGFVGRNLLRELRRDGHEITALYHRNPPPPEFADKINWIKADIHDVASLKTALAGMDIVYHLVGIIAETKTLTFEKTVIGGTRNLIEACLAENIKRIIYLSSLGTSSSASTKYSQAKWKAEETVRNCGLDYVILRPSIIFGPEDKFINRLARLIKYSPVMPIPGDGRRKLRPLYVGDLAAILKALMYSEKALGRTLEIGGPEEFDLRALISLLKKLLKKRRLNLYIPIWPLKIIAAGMEKVMKAGSPDS